jgi:hypothetical protein
MKRAGIDENETRFKADILRYLNNGGTVKRAQALLDGIANEMLGVGQVSIADDANSGVPVARQTNGDAAGHTGFAGDAKPIAPASPPTERSADGRSVTSGKAIDDVHSGDAANRERGAGREVPKGHLSAAPAREPSRAQNNAMIAARNAAASAVLKLGWLGSANVPGGPAYIDMRVCDLPGMIERQISEGATHARSAVALRMIEREVEKYPTADGSQKWIDVLPAETVRKISAATEAETLKPMAVGWLRGLHGAVGNVLERSDG